MQTMRAILVALFLGVGLAGCAQMGATYALNEIRKNADRGDAKAQYDVGRFYFFGWGVAQDPADRPPSSGPG